MVEQVTEEYLVNWDSYRGSLEEDPKINSSQQVYLPYEPPIKSHKQISLCDAPFKRSYETFMMDCLVSRQRQPVSNCIRLISFPFQFLVAHSRRLTRTKENKERSWNPKRKYSWKYASERRLKFTHRELLLGWVRWQCHLRTISDMEWALFYC